MSTTEKSFFSSLEKIFSSQKASAVREKAWDYFQKLGLPDKSWDAFKYVPLRRLYDLKLDTNPSLPSKEAIAAHVLPECQGSYVVFAKGRFIPELSELPSQLVAKPLSAALKTYGPVLQGRINSLCKEETDPFALLNLALQEESLFCYLPPKLKLEKPLQLIYWGEAGSYHAARLHLFCSSDSDVRTIAMVVGEGVHHTAIDVLLEERAHLSHLEMSTQSQALLLSDFKATLKTASQLNHLSLVANTYLTRHRLKVALIGEDANALLQGLWNLEASQQCHTHVHVEHVAPHCHSLQKYKGVLKGHAQSSFEGKIYVHPEAQKTEAYQLNNNLLLSEGAIANAKPNLEIFADDVKASHGATMSQVDEEQLFYLQSRGLSQETARTLLIRGFIQEMLDQIPYASLAHVFPL